MLINVICKVVGYVSGKNKASSFQMVDIGMYMMDKSDGSADDDKPLGGKDRSKEDEDDNNENKNNVSDMYNSVVVKVIGTPVINDDSHLYNGVTAPLGYIFTSELAFICFSPMLKC